MSSYFGRMGKGAARRLREQKRLEAEARNAATPPERRRAARREPDEAGLPVPEHLCRLEVAG